jgi:CDP-6-deoxy-D-xylo-4-hexulose-3-dehydrase
MNMYPLVGKKFGQTEIDAAIASMKTDQWTIGPNVRAIEKEFAEAVGAKYAVMVNSGSSANLVALTAPFFVSKKPLKRGDEVLVPAIAWATTWAPLWQLGLKMRIVDVDPETLNVDAEAFRKAITPKTQAILAVSILGNPADLEGIRSLCDEKGLHFIEDNCESIGATVGSRSAGTFADVGTFSMFYSHHISSIEGGMVVTDSDELYNICVCLRAHGWTRDLPAGSFLFPEETSPVKEQYYFMLPGYHVRPIEITAAVGRVQLEKLTNYLEVRRKNAGWFVQMMQGHPSLTIQKEKHGESSWYSFTMMLPSSHAQYRDDLFRSLAGAGIESRMITGGNFSRHPMAKYFDFTEASDMQHANRAHDAGLFVANHDSYLEEELKILDSTLSEFEKRVGLTSGRKIHRAG